MDAELPVDPSTNMPEVQPALPEQSSGFQRETPDPDNGRAELVKQMQASIKRDKTHWDEKAFKRMKRSARMVRDGADPQWKASGLYIANVAHRHVKQRTDSLYAKNPKVRVDRRKTLDFKVWDGTAQTLQAAAMDPMNNMELIQDLQQGAMRRKMLDGIARTMECVANNQINTQTPPFKINMKAMVTRTIIAGVGYVKLGYTRHMVPTPEVLAQTSNLEARLAYIEGLKADAMDDEMDGDADECADAEQLKLALAELQAAPMQVSEEGLRFDFPKSHAIIPDRKLRDLHGFQGCDYVTEEMYLTKQQIQEMFGVDIGSVTATQYHATEEKRLEMTDYSNADAENNRVCVWNVYHRRDGLMYWMVEGYKDFLTEPVPPPITLKRFWPWFALTFNIAEDEENPYPPSDVEMITHQVQEYNRARQGLRDHRIAARPKWVAHELTGLTDEDLTKITEADAHEVIRIKGGSADAKIENLLQMLKHGGIDQALYDVNVSMQDIERSVGSSSADMGAPSGVTATEASIGENAHVAGTSSSADDLDTLLSELFGEAGNVLLMEMDSETAIKIAGPGAVWPQLSPEDIMDDVWLDVQAGSSGRPNRALDMQAFTQIAPIMLQIPGISPQWMAEQAITRMDDRLDPKDAILDGVPSMLAMARIHQEQAMGAPAPGSVKPGDPQGSAALASHPAGPPGAPPGAPPGPPPQPGQAPVPQMGPNGGPPHPHGPVPPPGAPAGANPMMQSLHGAMNAPRPPGAVMRPPAMPAPGSGIVPMGR